MEDEFFLNKLGIFTDNEMIDMFAKRMKLSCFHSGNFFFLYAASGVITKSFKWNTKENMMEFSRGFHVQHSIVCKDAEAFCKYVKETMKNGYPPEYSMSKSE